MVKKQPKKPVDLSFFKGIGSAFRDIFVAAASHPTTAALAVMTTTVIVKVINNRKNPDLDWEMGGLYAGAQGLGLTAAVAPVVKSGFEAVGEIAKAKGPP